MKSLFKALLLLSITSISAQNTINGIVTDKSTNESIIFANIYLPELEKGTTTDDMGLFKIENLPSGTYTIIVSFIGYETLSLNIKFPFNEQLKIQLKPSAIEMEEIIVSTPFHKLQSENVMKVEHEKIDDLKAKGATTLAEGITNIAGVESVTTGLSIGKPVIRGLTANRVLVYTQGVRLENQQFGDEHGLGLSDSGIESVEVIKGPASLLYGSDALGGVLYLNPEKFAAANKSSGNLSANYYSNTQGFTTNAGYKASGDTFKLMFRGSLAEHSDYKTKAYRVTNTRFNEQDFKAAFGVQSEKFKSELRYNVNNIKPGIPIAIGTEELGKQSTKKTPLLPFQEVTNHVLSSKSVVFFNGSSLDVNLGLLYNDRKEFEEIPVPILHMKLKTLNYDVKYNMPTLGKFETIIGVQGMTQTNANYGEETLIPNANINDLGILAVSHIHFEKVDLQLGARFDNRNIEVLNGIHPNFNSFNGALGVRTNLTEQITARVNLATGFRAPNLAELTSDGVHEGTNRYEVGNPNLKNEQNFQTDLALEFKNEHIELFANAFYNQVNHYIFLSPNGTTIDNAPVYDYLQADANLYGGELGLHFHPHPLDWLHIESSFETVTGKQNHVGYLPLIPANAINSTIRIEYSDGWIANGYAFIKWTTTFDQNKVNQFETSTSGYSLLSAGTGGKIKVFDHELSISLSGNNLTNKRYINHLSRLKPDGIYNIGRNITVGLTYTL